MRGGDGKKGGDVRTVEEAEREKHASSKHTHSHTHNCSPDQRCENNSSSHSIIRSCCP